MTKFDKVSNWRVETYKHDENDGTSHTWRVVGDWCDHEGTVATVVLSDWLTEETARLIAAAPTMYEFIVAAAEAGDRQAIRILETIPMRQLRKADESEPEGHPS